MASETQNLPSLSPVYAHLLFCRGSRWLMPISAGPLSALYICRETSTNQPFYAKQTQFPKKSNERKYLFTNGI